MIAIDKILTFNDCPAGNGRVGIEGFVLNACKSKGLPPPQGVALGNSIQASVNQGRWIIECPFCTGAEFLDPADPRFYCLSCYNKAVGHLWLLVVLPEDRVAVERALIVRPMLENRNWSPGETVAQLHQENHKEGVS